MSQIIGMMSGLYMLNLYRILPIVYFYAERQKQKAKINYKSSKGFIAQDVVNEWAYSPSAP